MKTLSFIRIMLVLVVVGLVGCFAPSPAPTAVDEQIVISDEVKSKFPDLVPLILATESMDNEEKNYWFSLLPSMTDAQIAKLTDILTTERKKLDALERKYQSEIRQLNDKHMQEYNSRTQEN